MKEVIGLITANYGTNDMQRLSDERSIASMPFGGRYRLIDFSLSNMINSGITAVGLITPYKFRSLLDHIGTGSAWMLDRKKGGLYILPGTTYGMSDKSDRFLLCDMRQNDVYFHRTNAEYVLVTSANIVCNMDYTPLIEAHTESGADITMVTKIAERSNKYIKKVSVEDGRVTGVKAGVERGELAFLDSFIIRRELLIQFMEWYSVKEYMDIFDILRKDYKRMDIRTWNFDGYVREIFSVRDYYNTNMELLDMDINGTLFNEQMPIRTKVQDCVPAHVYPEAKVKNSLISSGCLIRGEVENSILFRGVTIEKGAVIRDSIIMQSSVIKSGAIVKNAVIDRNNLIGSDMVIKGSDEDIYVMLKEQRKAKKMG
ncbi:MAG: glucose-1-phosphate adenylyltransferase subunit GlgD [Lachnospiraceae bacterium]|jgi:glucose-1-phosphate adenylyltransferase|nr:glucose-1-phosphate adenylyltransferase subunit GlgD [Lachnospiraceae bacterium]